MLAKVGCTEIGDTKLIKVLRPLTDNDNDVNNW